MSTAQSAVVLKYRTIHIVCYTPSRLFPAHWSLWIPSKERPEIGTLIQVKGDSMTGFRHEIERGYNLSACDRRPWYAPLAQIEERHVTDRPTGGSDTTAYNYLEQVALSIPAPGPSLRNESSSVSISPLSDQLCAYTHRVQKQGRSSRVEIKNCQTWLRDVVHFLIDNNLIDSAAQIIVDQAPQH
jgi:hypothetical protein